MCSVKTPTVKKQDAADATVPYMRNSYFDGAGPLSQAVARGAGSFRINPGSARIQRGATTATTTTAPGTGGGGESPYQTTTDYSGLNIGGTATGGGSRGNNLSARV